MHAYVFFYFFSENLNDSYEVSLGFYDLPENFIP